VLKLRAFLKYWLPALIWMALIFSASSDANSFAHSSRIIGPLLHWLFPQMPDDTMYLIVLLVRKCAHLTEYAVFALLLWRALRKPVKNAPRPPAWPKLPTTQQAEPQPNRMPERESRTLRRGEGPWLWREARLALLIVALYAASDEFHQCFVPTRTGLVSDVFVDTAGGAAGLLALWAFGRRQKR